MNKRLVLVLFLVIGLLGISGLMFGGGANVVPESGMPVPGLEGIDETTVIDDESSGMPVPGELGIDEMIVTGADGAASSGMPVPGLEPVDEMIVTGADGAASSSMPVPGLEPVDEMIVIE